MILKKIYLYGSVVRHLKKNDVLLCSFPKAGNTWVRFVILELLKSKADWNTATSFDELNSVLPEIGVNNLSNKWVFDTYSLRMIKTHLCYNYLLRRPKILLLIRDPRDVMVSYYKYTNQNSLYRYDGDFAKFIRNPKYGIEALLQHYNSWKKRAELIIKYEDLKKDSCKQFSLIAKLLNMSVNDKEIIKAIKDADIRNVRKAQERSSIVFQKTFKNDYQFARKGVEGEWRSHFSPEDIIYYNELAEKYGYCERV